MTARTTAVAQYLAADVFRSQRILIPLFLYTIVIGLLLSDNPGPPPGVWPVTALALYPTATWLALIVANTEDPAQRIVTTIAAGGPGRLAAGTLFVALAADTVLIALSVTVSALRATGSYPPQALLSGALVHIAAATTGTAVGLLCARPLVTRVGWSFVIAVSVVTITSVQSWLPPVGSAVRALTTGGPAPVAQALLGLALAGAAAIIAGAVDKTR
ncbi:MAG: hypothetical protein ACRDTA_16695 [Pseudonocardiaceae bacterium]